MKFARIEMLFLIWSVPLLFLIFMFGMKKRMKILKAFSSQKGLKSTVPDISTGRRWLKAGLMLACLCFICIAMSGPQYGYKWQETEQKGIDIIIALDCSKSMLANDISPTRLDRAKRKIYDLLTILEGDRAGLVAFAGTAFLQCPLTLDYEAFNIFLNTLTPDFLPVGGTDISGAVAAAVAGFDQKTNSEKAVILITDGENTGKEDPIEAAKKAMESDVKLFCIGVGSEGGVPVPDEKGGFKKDETGKIIVTRLDEETLKKMAVMTGGTYVRSVSGDMDLDVIYKKEIRGKMEQSTLASGRKQVWEDRYQWVLIFAVIALLAEIFLPSIKKTAPILILAFLLISPYPVQAGPMQEGLEAYNKGEYETALKLFIDAQLDDPENPGILYNIGNTYYKMGNYESAAQNFKQALKTEDKNLKHKSLYNLGNTNFQNQEYEEAIKNYDEALKIAPDDIQAKENIEFVKKVMEQKKQEQKQCSNDNKDKKEDKEQDKQEQDKSQEQKDGSQEDKKENQPGEQKDQKEQQEYGNEMSEEEKRSSNSSSSSSSRLIKTRKKMKKSRHSRLKTHRKILTGKVKKSRQKEC